jgi:iron complex outermembrane receptor protein
VQYAAPSVTISDYGSANVFNLRGIGRSQVDVELPSGVVIYQDGAPTLAGYFQNEPYFDMAGIEVLRGPQGTFSGKSAAGGALFIRTRSPDLGEFTSNVDLGYGNFDQRELTGVVNVPLDDTLAVRVAYHSVPAATQQRRRSVGCEVAFLAEVDRQRRCVVHDSPPG